MYQPGPGKGRGRSGAAMEVHPGGDAQAQLTPLRQLVYAETPFLQRMETLPVEHETFSAIEPAFQLLRNLELYCYIN